MDVRRLMQTVQPLTLPLVGRASEATGGVFLLLEDTRIRAGFEILKAPSLLLRSLPPHKREGKKRHPFYQYLLTLFDDR